MRRLACCALIVTLAATAAYAAHPLGSPGNPASGDKWKELGHADGDGRLPGFTMYADESAIPIPHAVHAFRLRTWEVYDTPVAVQGGAEEAELEIDYVIDCSKPDVETIGRHPSSIEYAADGTVLYRTPGDGDNPAAFDPVEPGTLRARLADIACDFGAGEILSGNG